MNILAAYPVAATWLVATTTTIIIIIIIIVVCDRCFGLEEQENLLRELSLG